MTPFSVVLVPFPFADLSSAKRRPCLVLTSAKRRGLNRLLVVAMMTSQVHGLSFPHDVHLEEWHEAGLPKETLVRLAKIVTLDSSLISKKLGTITAADQEEVKSKFSALFEPLNQG